MQLVPATETDVSRFANVVADLVWSTGPASYGYQLGSRGVADALVAASWPVPGTVFSYDATTLALDDEELVGIEIGFLTPGFRARLSALGRLYPALIDAGVIDVAALEGIRERFAQSVWLNPWIPPDVYYIHAIAVSPSHRGRGVGALLMQDALRRARAAGAPALHLDVLSDNPAIDFYRAFGLECAVESKAPIPFSNGVPTECRMVIKLTEPHAEPASREASAPRAWPSATCC